MIEPDSDLGDRVSVTDQHRRVGLTQVVETSPGVEVGVLLRLVEVRPHGAVAWRGADGTDEDEVVVG